LWTLLPQYAQSHIVIAVRYASSEESKLFSNRAQSMIGLYYPYIHFQDENWLKLALIYWSKISRIVPASFLTHDSKDVRLVQSELGAIVNSSPHDSATADDFVKFIIENADALRAKYGIANANKWPVQTDTLARAPEGTDARFSFIFHEKLGDELRNVLLHEGLGIWGEGSGPSFDPRWVGVHPEIAAVYMTSMAESIARASGFSLLSDEVTSHVVVGERSINRLAEMLLNERFEARDPNLITHEAVAVMALKTVLPLDLASIPMKKIVQFRNKHATELADFQTWVHAATKSLNDITHSVTSPEATGAVAAAYLGQPLLAAAGIAVTMKQPMQLPDGRRSWHNHWPPRISPLVPAAESCQKHPWTPAANSSPCCLKHWQSGVTLRNVFKSLTVPPRRASSRFARRFHSKRNIVAWRRGSRGASAGTWRWLHFQFQLIGIVD
jgi:hypothetical protein